MPTYEYACTSCGERLEVVQKFTDDPLTVCPACEGALRKVFSPVGVVFKGSGFYKTDSRTSKTSAGAKTDAATSDGGAKEKTSSETGSTAGADTAAKPAAETKPAATPPSSGTSKSSSVASGDRVA